MEKANRMDLTSLRTLGRSGLIVSPLALGTMTFGADRWGTSEESSRAVLDVYVGAGGNFIDTADVYGGGRSEEFIGRYVAERGLRDKLVLGTKFTWNLEPGNPNAGGNGRKNVHRALEASLRRLRTDYVDVVWQHFWDMVTPVEEMLQTMGDLVRSGKARYFALSDVPAWYATKMAVLAAAHGVPGPIAIQTEHSLVERASEREHLPAARECGLGLVAWSPLAGGFLTGKYQRTDGGGASNERLRGANPFGKTKFTERNWRVLDVLSQVARAAARKPAQVSLAWALARPGVSAIILGASSETQLKENLDSLGAKLSKEQVDELDNASRLENAFPYAAYTDPIKRSIFGGCDVTRWT
jgi:aryl-alcohol dehydrogenase-like predicted oxidoreductase